MQFVIQNLYQNQVDKKQVIQYSVNDTPISKSPKLVFK